MTFRGAHPPLLGEKGFSTQWEKLEGDKGTISHGRVGLGVCRSSRIKFTYLETSFEHISDTHWGDDNKSRDTNVHMQVTSPLQPKAT